MSEETVSLVALQMEERRQRIREASRSLLAASGYQGLTMRKLAAACGLSVPTLYNLVGSKATIIAEDAIDSIGEAAARMEGPEVGVGVERVFALHRVICGAVLDRSDYFRALLPHIDAVPELRDVRQTVADSMVERLVAELSTAPLGTYRDDVDLHLVSNEIFDHALSVCLGWAVRRVTSARLEPRMNHGTALILGACVTGPAADHLVRIRERAANQLRDR